ncbi:MAG: hypothetical protein K0U66_05855 [Gammaproteobacteria bacterium]|nr:hypothetical protein [Gammaproteobacteria bacterium]
MNFINFISKLSAPARPSADSTGGRRCALRSSTAGWPLALIVIAGLAGTSCASKVDLAFRHAEEVKLPQITPEQFASGGTHNCLIDVHGHLHCWGNNSEYQLGRKSYSKQSFTMGMLSVGSCWKSVGAGFKHSCAIYTDGSLLCWGNNQYGQLGIGNNLEQEDRVHVGEDNDWHQVSSGYSMHTCAIKTDESMHCWGLGAYGSLGSGNLKTYIEPKRTAGEGGWKNVSTGFLHTCAIKHDDSLHCWGHNEAGQVGANDRQIQASPVQIGTDKDWKNVSPGAFHTCAVKTNGQLWCWGLAKNGRLGLGDIDSADVAAVESFSPEKEGILYQYFNTQVNVVNRPVRVGTASNWKQVSSGSNYSCAIDTDARMWCWGNNKFGQLGRGSGKDRLVPSEVESDEKWEFVSAGYLHNCAVSKEAKLYCWGDNRMGAVDYGSQDYLVGRPAKTSIKDLDDLFFLQHMENLAKEGVAAQCTS